ncbi:hypothetical protein [Bacillus toyonensis]|uniref:hypothetical protein n=1 Tax=Bacillus toyonensis TaxID=155322 RepID=UPI0021D1F373|nr:hypothetical protein [Bacillus toyonensis]MCU4770735.1 hypothetical protein [Bacillus toyonensis]
MAGNNVKVIKYSGLSSGKLKYPVAKTVIGTIIKANGPYYRVKTELGKIVEITKSAVFEMKDK